MQHERQPLRLTSPGGIDGKVGAAQITMQHDLRFVVNIRLQQSISLQNLRASESTASRPLGPGRSVEHLMHIQSLLCSDTGLCVEHQNHQHNDRQPSPLHPIEVFFRTTKRLGEKECPGRIIVH